MNQTKKVTLITGANKGIGFEIAKQVGEHGHHVLVGSRDEKRGAEAVKQLLDLGIEADFIQIDVTNKESINKAAELIEEKYGYLTALINNAGISLDKFIVPSKLDTEIIRQDFDVNFFGLVDTTQAMLPLLKKSTKAKIINMSSMMGSLNIAATPESEVYHASVVGYQASKVAVNMFTIKLAKELEDLKETTITVNAVDPGMVATEFGGVDPEFSRSHGGKPVEEGAKRAVELAVNDDDTSNATFSNAEGVVAW